MADQHHAQPAFTAGKIKSIAETFGCDVLENDFDNIAATRKLFTETIQAISDNPELSPAINELSSKTKGGKLTVINTLGWLSLLEQYKDNLFDDSNMPYHTTQSCLIQSGITDTHHPFFNNPVENYLTIALAEKAAGPQPQ